MLSDEKVLFGGKPLPSEQRGAPAMQIAQYTYLYGLTGFDESFLNALPAVEETQYLRHVRFDKSMIIKMDGKKSLGVVLKP